MLLPRWWTWRDTDNVRIWQRYQSLDPDAPARLPAWVRRCRTCVNWRSEDGETGPCTPCRLSIGGECITDRWGRCDSYWPRTMRHCDTCRHWLSDDGVIGECQLERDDALALPDRDEHECPFWEARDP